MAAKLGVYKGHPTITLNPENRFPFTFGLGKAKLILDNLAAIKEFVAAAEGVAEVEPPVLKAVA